MSGQHAGKMSSSPAKRCVHRSTDWHVCVCSSGKKKEGPYKYENIIPPAEVDWRTKDVVGPIKNQHVGGAPCGCCWAFATIGVTECIVALATGKPISLSEQQLIDCDKAGEWSACNLCT